MKVLVVLGNILDKNGNMSYILKKRLDLCLKKYNEGDKVIVAGGNTARVEHTEAYVMSKYLISKGVKKKDIIKENSSLDTIGNIKNIYKILKAKKYFKVHLITSKSHVKRVKKIVKDIIDENYMIKYYTS